MPIPVARAAIDAQAARVAKRRRGEQASVKVTSAKRTANAVNAQGSTGPRTEAGKSVSRLNGLRHGLRAEFVVVPRLEDAGEWEAHRSAVAEVLAPANYLEALFADRAALATWRLRRGARCERGILAQAQVEAEEVAGDSLRLSHCLHYSPIRTLEAATKEALHYRNAIAFVEQLDNVKADLESSLENEVLFDDVLKHAAGVAGIALEQREDEDWERWFALPASVYERADSRRAYWPTLGELRDGFAAIVVHSAGATGEEIVEDTLGWLRELAERAGEQEAAFAAAVEREREKNAVPIALAAGGYSHHDELITRYETAAERTLQRAIEGIRALRALGSVGKTEGPREHEPHIPSGDARLPKALPNRARKRQARARAVFARPTPVTGFP